MRYALLPEVCEIQYGYAFDSALFSEHEGRPLIRIRDVVRGYTETLTTESCSDEYIVHAGDMLIGMDGEFNIERWKSGDALLNQRVCKLVPKHDIDGGYLYYFMPSALKAIEDKTPFVTVKHLSAKQLNAIQIPILDIEEQREIAAVLDKVSGLIAMRKKQLQKLDDLVKARFVEMFGDPIKNDKGLPTVSGEAFFKLSNGKALPDSKRYTDGIPAYGGNGISWYTDEILCDYDTIIVGRVGFQSGNVHLAKAPLWVTDNAMYISSINSKECDIRFLCALMEHIDFTRFQDAGDLKKITQKPFMQMQYIMPSMAMQLQYIAFVEQTDKSKLTIQQSLDKLELMKKALMQKYFGGIECAEG